MNFGSIEYKGSGARSLKRIICIERIEKKNNNNTNKAYKLIRKSQGLNDEKKKK